MTDIISFPFWSGKERKGVKDTGFLKIVRREEISNKEGVKKGESEITQKTNSTFFEILPLGPTLGKEYGYRRLARDMIEGNLGVWPRTRYISSHRYGRPNLTHF